MLFCFVSTHNQRYFYHAMTAVPLTLLTLWVRWLLFEFRSTMKAEAAVFSNRVGVMRILPSTHRRSHWIPFVTDTPNESLPLVTSRQRKPNSSTAFQWDQSLASWLLRSTTRTSISSQSFSKQNIGMLEGSSCNESLFQRKILLQAGRRMGGTQQTKVSEPSNACLSNNCSTIAFFYHF